MKSSLTLIAFTLSLLLTANSYANTTIKIEGQQAKDLYNSLTGKAVEVEGATGHQYRAGPGVNCRYTLADMDDAKDKPVPQLDPQRYACSLQVDENGMVTEDSHF